MGLRSSFLTSTFQWRSGEMAHSRTLTSRPSTKTMSFDMFNYRRSLLEHTALDAISGLRLSAANYKETVEILQKRFGDKPLIISKHMETLLNAEPVTSDQSLKELKHLYDATQSHLRRLKSLGIELASYGAMLSPVLLMKLSPEVGSMDLKMDNLLKIFEGELVAREGFWLQIRPNSTMPKKSRERPTAILSTIDEDSGSRSWPRLLLLPPSSLPTRLYCCDRYQCLQADFEV